MTTNTDKNRRTKLKNIHERFEIFLEQEKDSLDEIIQLSRNIPQAKEHVMRSITYYNNVVWAVNKAYEIICQEFNSIYKKIGEEFDISSLTRR